MSLLQQKVITDVRTIKDVCLHFCELMQQQNI